MSDYDEEDEKPDWLPLYWLNGHPLRFDSHWIGRGMHFELGQRACLSLWKSDPTYRRPEVSTSEIASA